MKTKNQRGVALLMSLSILALLSVVGVSYATAMRLGQRSAQDFFRNIQAKYFAEGGIQRAIGELKYNNSVDPAYSEGAMYQFCDSSDEWWYFKERNPALPYTYYAGTKLENLPAGSQASIANEADPTGPADIVLGKGYTAHYNLKIIDAGSQLNVNDIDNDNMQILLQNLFVYLGSPLDVADANAVFTNRPYKTKEEIRQYLPGTSSAKQQKYDMIKDFITVNSYHDTNQNKDSSDPSSLGKSPINLNTASWQVMASVLNPLLGSAAAETAAKGLRNNHAYKSWAAFNWGMGAYTALSPSDKNAVNNLVNPNRTTNVATDTKFHFNSGGYYDVECLATIRDTHNNVVASKKIATNIKIFDMWNMTTKEQFRGEDANYNGAQDAGEDVNGNGYFDRPLNYDRITWFDSCPLNINASYSGYQYNSGNNAETIPGALKLGYWDNFTEDTAYSQSVWRVINGPAYSTSGGALTTGLTSGWPIAGLGLYNDPNKKWKWEYFSVRTQLHDICNPPLAQNLIGSHWYKSIGGGNFVWSYGDIGVHLFVNSITDSGGGTQQYDVYIGRADPAATCYYRTHNDPVTGLPYIHDQKEPITPCLYISGYSQPIGAYNADKTFSIARTGDYLIDNADVDVYYSPGGSDSFNQSIPHNAAPLGGVAGCVRVYGATSGFSVNDIRIIGICSIAQQLATAAVGGYYDYSPRPAQMPLSYEWGVVYTSVTAPSTANGDSERVRLSTRTNGTAAWNLIGESSAANMYVSGQIQAANLSNMDYRLELLTNDDDFSETPVVEDVWITYLPKSRILYWKEN